MPLIRPATESDATAIAHVHIQSWRSTYAGIIPTPFLAALNEADRTAQWSEWLKLELPVYVADHLGEIVGFIGGGPIREPVEPYDAELFAIYLLEGAQRQGTGSTLLKALARELHQRGFTNLIAWVLESNVSRHFYEATGAHPI
jgi:L-amino acid N-acyltransferase YncA